MTFDLTALRDDGGSGYSTNALSAPYVLTINDPNDAFGCANPCAGDQNI